MSGPVNNRVTVPTSKPLPIEFLATIRDMNRRLGRFYQRLVPNLRRRFRDNTEEQLEEIKILIATAEEHLELANSVREVGEKIVPLLQPNEVVTVQELLGVMGVWEEEFDEAVEYFREVLKKCSLTLEGLSLEHN